ncbi:MAG TPA: acylglycerol kinase family protein, partial [Burkholderiales bacterium]|nr:acylglycerol kinase family protein [Burkholderiales bacterium]
MDRIHHPFAEKRLSRVALLVNPSAGRGAGRRLAPEVRECLRQAGAECEIQFTSGPGEMRALVAAALRGGADCVA